MQSSLNYMLPTKFNDSRQCQIRKVLESHSNDKYSKCFFLEYEPSYDASKYLQHGFKSNVAILYNAIHIGLQCNIGTFAS